jgi:rare lipoprotein A (peptidoglycan hydrolase)
MDIERRIDLSYGAAKALDMLYNGRQRVRVSVPMPKPKPEIGAKPGTRIICYSHPVRAVQDQSMLHPNIRVRCRNQRCRSKLPVPTDNDRDGSFATDYDQLSSEIALRFLS